MHRIVFAGNTKTGAVLYTEFLSNVYDGLSSRDEAIIDAICCAVAVSPEYLVFEVYSDLTHQHLSDCLVDFSKKHHLSGNPVWFPVPLYL